MNDLLNDLRSGPSPSGTQPSYKPLSRYASTLRDSCKLQCMYGTSAWLFSIHFFLPQAMPPRSFLAKSNALAYPNALGGCCRSTPTQDHQEPAGNDLTGRGRPTTLSQSGAFLLCMCFALTSMTSRICPLVFRCSQQGIHICFLTKHCWTNHCFFLNSVHQMILPGAPSANSKKPKATVPAKNSRGRIQPTGSSRASGPPSDTINGFGGNPSSNVGGKLNGTRMFTHDATCNALDICPLIHAFSSPPCQNMLFSLLRLPGMLDVARI